MQRFSRQRFGGEQTECGSEWNLEAFRMRHLRLSRELA